MWIAQALRKDGVTLKPGDLLSLGGYIPPAPTQPGTSITVKYLGLPGDPSVTVHRLDGSPVVQSSITTTDASSLQPISTRRPTSGSTPHRQAGVVTISSPKLSVRTRKWKFVPK